MEPTKILIESYDQLVAGDVIYDSVWCHRVITYQYRRGNVPCIHHRVNGHCYRRPRTFATLREIAKYSGATGWKDADVAMEPPLRQKKADAPSAWDDQIIYYTKSWKKQRKTKWRKIPAVSA